jgi:hypothetical protein
VLASPIQVAGRGLRAVAAMAAAPSLVSSLAPGQLIPFRKLKIHRGNAPAFQQRRSAVTAFANAIVKSSRQYAPGTAPVQNVVGQDTDNVWKPRIGIQPCQGVRYDLGGFNRFETVSVTVLRICIEPHKPSQLPGWRLMVN